MEEIKAHKATFHTWFKETGSLLAHQDEKLAHLQTAVVHQQQRDFQAVRTEVHTSADNLPQAMQQTFGSMKSERTDWRACCPNDSAAIDYGPNGLWVSGFNGFSRLWTFLVFLRLCAASALKVGFPKPPHWTLWSIALCHLYVGERHSIEAQHPGPSTDWHLFGSSSHRWRF